MKLKIYIKWTAVILIAFLSSSCEEFVEIEAPNNQLIREEVFNSDATAKSSMTGIYNELFLAAFSNGSRNSVTILSGLSADNLENINTTNLSRMEFQQNELSPGNGDNLELWASAYNMVYLTNSFLEGLEETDKVSSELKTQLEGEARFIRAFTYFYLVNLYGDVPLILTTNYRDNELAFRTPQSDVYEQIQTDLSLAISLLDPEYDNGERTQVNSFAAKALMARVYLYLENWEMAESFSTEVIDESATYEILEDLNTVFLANSSEAIWQISPIGGGGIVTHTNEGSLLLIDPIFSFFASLKLEEGFVENFQESDKRLSEWVSYNSSKNAFFSSKYKIRNSTEFPIKEYSMVLRLAEQYLIRAEARAQMENLEGAIEDLDVIRQRAGIELLAETNPSIGKQELLNKIYEERRMELFTEWGHRWLDLKRTERADEVLGSNNPLWDETDVLYPIPTEEIRKNPNLIQNEGY